MIRLARIGQFAAKKIQLFNRGRPLLNYRIPYRFSQNQKKDEQNKKGFQSEKVQVSSQSQKVQVSSQSQKVQANSQSQKVQDFIFTQKQKQMINSYKQDQFWNNILGIDKNYNFQKELIISKKIYQRNTKQLRNAILFQDLLRNEVNIPIYDTKGKIWTHNYLKILLLFTIVGGSVYTIFDLRYVNAKTKVIMQKTSLGKLFMNTIIVLSTYLFLSTFVKHYKFARRFVEKIVYNTQTQNFTFVMRNFFGFKRIKQVSRYKIVYTENVHLNKFGTNYFHLDTKQQYSIGFKEFWIKEDLFSHLIAQRIKI